MSGTKNNRELYKAAFSKLHASDAVIRKEEEMTRAKKTIRLNKLAVVCLCIALLTGATSGIAYAATDGATANPVKAVKILINGQELGADIVKNDDGTYTVHIESETFRITDGSSASAAAE